MAFASAAPSFLRPVEMRTLPPFGIASRALTIRFKSAVSNCALSMLAASGLRSSAISSSIGSGQARRSTASNPSIRALMLLISGRKGWRREKASNCSVRRSITSGFDPNPCSAATRTFDESAAGGACSR